MKNAKAAVFMEAGKPFIIEEFEISKPKVGMALLELEASGVCGTDVHIYKGKLGGPGPKIIGHEFVGKIIDISKEDSEKTGLKIGDVAIVDIACPCGECDLCKAGDDANCVNMKVTNGGNPYEGPHFHGGYCQVTYAPVTNLIKVPEGVDPLAACVFACPGPTALHGFSLAEKAGVKIENTKVAVVQGAGPVGSMAIAYLASLGIDNVVVLDFNTTDDKAKLINKLGATEIIDVAKTEADEVVSRIKELSGGLGADLVFEASGNPQAVPMGMSILRNRGTYIVPGQYSNSGGVEIQPQIITFKALHIIGSSQYSFCDVYAYVDFLAKNPALCEVIKDLAATYHVEDVNKAFEDAIARKNVKTVLIK